MPYCGRRSTRCGWTYSLRPPRHSAHRLGEIHGGTATEGDDAIASCLPEHRGRLGHGRLGGVFRGFRRRSSVPSRFRAHQRVQQPCPSRRARGRCRARGARSHAAPTPDSAFDLRRARRSCASERLAWPYGKSLTWAEAEKIQRDVTGAAAVRQGDSAAMRNAGNGFGSLAHALLSAEARRSSSRHASRRARTFASGIFWPMKTSCCARSP